MNFGSQPYEVDRLRFVFSYLFVLLFFRLFRNLCINSSKKLYNKQIMIYENIYITRLNWIFYCIYILSYFIINHKVIYWQFSNWSVRFTSDTKRHWDLILLFFFSLIPFSFFNQIIRIDCSPGVVKIRTCATCAILCYRRANGAPRVKGFLLNPWRYIDSIDSLLSGRARVYTWETSSPRRARLTAMRAFRCELTRVRVSRAKCTWPSQPPRG